MKKLIYITIVFVIILLICIILINSKDTESKQMTEKQIISKCEDIIAKWSNNNATARLIDLENKKILSKAATQNAVTQQCYDNFNEDERIVYLASGTDFFGKVDTPREVYAIFEVFLYLQDKRLPWNLTAVACRYASNLTDSAIDENVMITYVEYNDIYNDFKFEKIGNIEEFAMELGDRWISKAGYKRFG